MKRVGGCLERSGLDGSGWGETPEPREIRGREGWCRGAFILNLNQHSIIIDRMLGRISITLSIVVAVSSAGEDVLKEEKRDRCIGLVLKGGANRGSYEAGAIYALV